MKILITVYLFSSLSLLMAAETTVFSLSELKDLPWGTSYAFAGKAIVMQNSPGCGLSLVDHEGTTFHSMDVPYGLTSGDVLEYFTGSKPEIPDDFQAGMVYYTKIDRENLIILETPEDLSPIAADPNKSFNHYSNQLVKFENVNIGSQIYNQVFKKITLENGISTNIYDVSAPAPGNYEYVIGVPISLAPALGAFAPVEFGEMLGVSKISADDEAPVTDVYNIAGQRMNADNLPAGVYVVRRTDGSSELIRR